jgi:type IV fimbrial biogenesis protein FimT
MRKHNLENCLTHKRAPGFTLIEALIVVSIAAMLLSMAAPSYRDFTMNNVLISSINDFNGILQFARSQSVHDRTNVTLCTSDDQASCAAHGNWQTGWIAFTTNADGTRNILKIGESIASRNLTLNATGFANSGRIDYTSQGILANNDSRGTFTLWDTRGVKSAKAIIINAVGRTQRAFDQNNNGVVEDHNTVDVTCP